MKITIVRHGQTSRNKENRVLGRSDFPLDEIGLLQAEAAGKRLKNNRYDAVYSSPMKRAYQTARAIMEANFFPVPIVKVPALVEQNFGVFEGALRDDPDYQKEKHLYFKPFEGGESFLDVAARVYRFLDDLIDQSDENASVLLVAHGGICRLVENYFQGMDNESFASYFLQNCEARTFDTSTKHRDDLSFFPVNESTPDPCRKLSAEQEDGLQ